MPKKRRTRKQKTKAAKRRQDSYSAVAPEKNLTKDVSISVDKKTTSNPKKIEYKNLITSVGIFLVLVIIQLVINWLIVD